MVMPFEKVLGKLGFLYQNWKKAQRKWKLNELSSINNEM